MALIAAAERREHLDRAPHPLMGGNQDVPKPPRPEVQWPSGVGAPLTSQDSTGRTFLLRFPATPARSSPRPSSKDDKAPLCGHCRPPCPPPAPAPPAQPRRPAAPSGAGGDAHPADQPCIRGPPALLLPQTPSARLLSPWKVHQPSRKLPVLPLMVGASLVSAIKAHQASGHWQALPLFCPI